MYANVATRSTLHAPHAVKPKQTLGATTSSFSKTADLPVRQTRRIWNIPVAFSPLLAIASTKMFKYSSLAHRLRQERRQSSGQQTVGDSSAIRRLSADWRNGEPIHWIT
jgi:hypothetical protein